MQIIIMHKDIVAGKYDFESRDFSIEDPNHLPVQNAVAFLEWLDRRNMPVSRPFTEPLYAKFEIDRPSDLAKISHNTSVTDCYWFATDDELKDGLKWEDVNPHNHEWSESGEAMFIGHPEIVEDLDSPDFATGGYLPKVWIKQPDQIYLLKRDGGDGLNTFAEIAASEMATALNINHVNYFFSVTGGEICTGCPCIIESDEEELIPFSLLMAKGSGWEELVSRYHIEKEFGKMQAFDFLSGNWNRSLDDIAMIRDPNTLKIKGMSPLYDHGNAFLFTDNEDEMRKMMKIAKANIHYMDSDIDFVKFTDTMMKIADELELQKSDIMPFIDQLESRIRIYKSFII